jgi:hypothetical protein
MKSQFTQTLEFLRHATIKNKPVKIKSDNYYREHALDSVKDRNTQYSTFLSKYVDNYVSRAKVTNVMKIIFFTFIMIFLLAMVSICIIAFINITKKPDITYPDIATVITAVGGIIASFIVLPKVVAENLFPSKEEDRTADIFNSLINYDLELEKFYVIQEKPKEKSNCEQVINSKETETLRT